jgi:hypothetical protein
MTCLEVGAEEEEEGEKDEDWENEESEEEESDSPSLLRYFGLVEEVDAVFYLFGTLRRGELSEVARCVHFPRSTVDGWWRDWSPDLGWRWYASKTGHTGTVSTKQEEDILSEHEEQFCVPKRPLSSRVLSRCNFLREPRELSSNLCS